MARVNIYLPDELVAELRGAGLNLSQVTRVAVHRALARSRTDAWLWRCSLGRTTVQAHATVQEALRRARAERGLPP